MFSKSWLAGLVQGKIQLVTSLAVRFHWKVRTFDCYHIVRVLALLYESLSKPTLEIKQM